MVIHLTSVRQSITLQSKEIEIDEVEDACENQIDVLSGYGGRQMLFGKTSKGRYITVILMQKIDNNYYVVTARDTSKKERRYVHDKEKSE